ncbi:hypothetical protein [Georgenia sp. AZ-5]|uniref:hypothetical protein n=1 Tax=Georgenia sp. AZ-5 TaxID=3367526 RepID=UPI0037541EBC
MFTVEQVVEYFAGMPTDPTAEQIGRAALRVGVGWYPALVYMLFLEGLLAPSAAAACVPAAWQTCLCPELELDEQEWRDLFAHAGVGEERA